MLTRLVPLTLVAFSLVACDRASSRRDADASESSVAATPAAPRVQNIELGKDADDESLRVTSEATTFAPDDTMFLAVVVQNPDADSRLTARWTYQDGSVVDSSGQGVDRAMGSSTSVTQFKVHNDEGWPLGRYSVDVWMNGTLVGSRAFTVARQ